MIRMIAVLTSLLSASAFAFDQQYVKDFLLSKSSIMLGTGIIFLMMSIVIFRLSRKNQSLRKTNKKLINKDWSNVINQKSKKNLEVLLNSMDSFAIAQIDSNDKIIFVNKTFLESFGPQQNWSMFFTQQFKIDKQLKGLTNIYKNINDIRSDYFITVTEKNAHGYKFAFVQKIDSLVLKRVADYRNDNLEKNKTNAFDILESSINRYNSFRTSSKFNLQSGDYAENLAIYLPENMTQIVFDYYVRAIVALSRCKTFSSEVEIKTSRNEERFTLSSFIPEISLTTSDMSKVVPFGGQSLELGSILKGVNDLLQGYEVNLTVKNVESAQRQGVLIELNISDMENVKVRAFEYQL